MLDAEVAVIGIGTVGSMTLWQLAAQGVDVIGFERYAPGHDRGAVGGETRLFRMAYAEGDEYTGLLRRAVDGWRELESESGTELLVQCGGLSIGRPDEPYVAGVLSAARTGGVPVEVLDRAHAAERYPQHALRQGEVAVLDAQAGYLRCESGVLAATARAEALGARVIRYAQVTRIEPAAGHAVVRAQGRTWRFRRVVISAGSWSGPLLPPSLGVRSHPRRVLLSWFVARSPAEFTPERFPVFVRETGGVHIYGAPSVDGATVKVAGASPARPIENPDAVNRRHAATEVRQISEAVSECLPGLHPDPVRMDAFTDLYTTDQVPLVGPVPGAEHLIVATGFSGRGFKFSPAIGAAVANLARGRWDEAVRFCSPMRPFPPSTTFGTV